MQLPFDSVKTCPSLSSFGDNLEFCIFQCARSGWRTFCFFGGSMRKVDRLGRIVIPKELRTKYGMFEGQDVSFEESSRGILVRATGELCLICNEKIQENSKFPLCERCITAIKEI